MVYYFLIDFKISLGGVAVSKIFISHSSKDDIVPLFVDYLISIGIPNKNIFFIPDENLGRHIAEKLPDKHFIFNDGFCHVHKSIHKEDILKAKEVHPEAMVLAHPECTPDTLSVADFIGSTSQIIDYATSSEKNSFIICTEMGIFYELMQKNPEKKFYSVGHRQFCPNMKKVNLENVLESLEKMAPEIELDEELRESARKPLKRMLELAAN